MYPTLLPIIVST